MPFDRLIQAVDAWAGDRRRDDVFAQIGESTLEPRHVAWTRFLEPDAFRQHVAQSRAMVAHAGTGSILTALEHGKPILVLPRRASRRETRNDHQVATAERFAASGRVLVAMDETELPSRLAMLDSMAVAGPIARHASAELIAVLAAFVAAV
jgi:UDP-N-acetylglucosamine transferase subunit ALG13